MTVDTPARIAVFGAGPIGLETALYARFLGFDVDVYEQAEIAANVRQWGHVRMFSPFSMNVSSLGLAALAAQTPGLQLPDDDRLMTGAEYVDQYLLPLSETDLLSDCIHTRSRVVSVARDGFLKTEAVGQSERARSRFRILIANQRGDENYALADVVIDATGSWNQPRCLGRSGMPALGENHLRGHIAYHIPDVLGGQRDRYGGRHTLVVGSGFSAATSVIRLAELSRSIPNTKVTWITRRDTETPLTPIADDPLHERRRITAEANALAQSGEPLRHLRGCELERISRVSKDELVATVVGAVVEDLAVNEIIANVGFQPDTSIFSELQVHRCYATDGPMKLAASLLSSTNDCLQQPHAEADSLLTTEANFYVVGSKSYGRNSHFLISQGLAQIQELFTVVADRPSLNLYANMRQHLSS